MPTHPEESVRRGSSFIDWLSYELAPREGRLLAVIHIATACAITVAIAMIFRIPEPTYMGYMVFLTSKDEKSATLITGIGGMIAGSLAIVLTLGLSLVDLSEPALRLPAMAAVTFLGMYSARTLKLGPITYLAGFVIVLLQTLIDDMPSPESYTRITLWVWVVLFVPITTTTVLNWLFGASKELLVRRGFKRLLSEMSEGLVTGDLAGRLPRWRETAIQLLEKTPPVKPRRAIVSVDSAALQRLLDILIVFEAIPTTDLNARGATWAKMIRTINASVGRRRDSAQTSVAVTASSPSPIIDQTPNGQVLARLLTELQDSMEHGNETLPPAKGAPQPVLTADALTNPSHWQFALKTTIAVMTVYSIYTMLNWPGLRTSVVTCFFVALGSLGETVHKLTLRITGAIVGGALAALCIVFVLPHFTDIGQLCLLIGVVAAGAAWIATSSEQLAYAGMQMAFAFFLGVLQGYAPATDLTVLRDRIAGILLGNIVMTIVFSVFWPESATLRIRSAIAEALRAIGALLSTQTTARESRLKAARALVGAEHFRVLHGFELPLVPGYAISARLEESLHQLAKLEGSVFAATTELGRPSFDEASRNALARWANKAAISAERGQVWPAAPTPSGTAHSERASEIMQAASAAVESSQWESNRAPPAEI
jgi:multidrug resistance protein MdtO